MEISRIELLKKIDKSKERLIQQKEKSARESQVRLIELSMRKQDIEDNLRMKEKAKEFNRLKKLAEIEKRNERIENLKKQKMMIYEERRKMNQTLERDKQYMLLKFNGLMSQRGGKTKEPRVV